MERRYICSYCSSEPMLARAEKSAGGGKTRFSRSRDSKVSVTGAVDDMGSLNLLNNYGAEMECRCGWSSGRDRKIGASPTLR
jgi:hypothetical protein